MYVYVVSMCGKYVCMCMYVRAYLQTKSLLARTRLFPGTCICRYVCIYVCMYVHIGKKLLLAGIRPFHGTFMHACMYVCACILAKNLLPAGT